MESQVSLLLLERGMPGITTRQMQCSGVWPSGTTCILQYYHRRRGRRGRVRGEREGKEGNSFFFDKIRHHF